MKNDLSISQEFLLELKAKVNRFEDVVYSLTEPEFHELENVIKEAITLIKRLHTKAVLSIQYKSKII